MKWMCWLTRIGLWMTLVTGSHGVPAQIPTGKARFEHLSLEQGLSSSAVYAILQDRQGFIWVGTQEGLNRYDGYHFDIFHSVPADTQSLCPGYIRVLFEDRHGILWIGSDAGLTAYNPSSGRFTRYVQQLRENPALKGKDHAVWTIQEDRSGKLWVGVYDGGLYWFDRKTNHFEPYIHPTDRHQPFTSQPIWVIQADRAGTLWVGTQGMGLYALKPETGQLAHYQHNPRDSTSLSGNVVLSLCEDQQGQLWVGTEGQGLNCLQPRTGRFRRYLHEPGRVGSLSDNVVWSLRTDRAGTLWVGTDQGGLNALDAKTSRFIHYQNNSGEITSLSNNTVFGICEDRAGTLWVGTFGGGINLLDQRSSNQFLGYQHPPGAPNSANRNIVRTLFEDQEGRVWVGTHGGLQVLGRENGQFHSQSVPVQLKSMVQCITEGRDGTIWLGTTEEGPVAYHPRQGNRSDYPQNSEDPKARSHRQSAILALHEDRAGRMWIATEGNGLHALDVRNGRFQVYQQEDDVRSLSSNLVTNLWEDGSGTLWVATFGGGLCALDQERKSFTRYRNDPKDPTSLSNNQVSCLYEDPAGNLWVGTFGGGLDVLNKKTGYFRHFREREGLPNNVINGILPDRHGSLWLSTNRGLCQFTPPRRIWPKDGAASPFLIRNFDQRDGLQGNEFNMGAYCRGKDGWLYFGGINGFSTFHPDSIRPNSCLPPVVITRFRVFEKPHQLDSTITHKKRITLSYQENFFSFEFAALNFILPEKNQYAYRMVGFDVDWIPAGTRRYASYTNLPPGTYTFRVKASNNDGLWNEQGASLTLFITPPFWQTGWAYAGYVLLGMGVLYGLRQYVINRERLRGDLRMKRLEAEKLQEMDTLKSRFFANISHEFRTPLTLILGPAQEALAQRKDPADQQPYGLIYRNAQRLLQLVNQLLDLSKLEAGSMQMDLRPGDVIQFLRVTAFSFSSLAERKGIDFQHQFPDEGRSDAVNVYFDEDKLAKIVDNLLSNACKFTPAGGRVALHVSWQAGEPFSKTVRKPGNTVVQWLEIVVQDSGIGIPDAQVEQVFNRFYQVDSSLTRQQSGTGIGLALTKELVDLYQGSISLTSEEGKGARFVVLLPLRGHAEPTIPATGQTHRMPSPGVAEPEMQDGSLNSGNASLPLVLIVEDNAEVRTFIRQGLNEAAEMTRYRIAESGDGEAGFAEAIAQIPDLIISDVMMPKLNGFQLCQRLKTDERTSHVPVILLTARAGDESEIAGLETGADDYMTKPFNVQTLRVKVKNLIDSRKQLRERFRRELILQPAAVAITSMDERFLRKVMRVIEANLSEEDFSVEVLGREIGMSRVQLYRKLLALTDQSPSDFIRTIRLQRAAALLSKRSGSVSEIGYQVGYSDPSHFARSFTRQFGVSPSEYANRAILS